MFSATIVIDNAHCPVNMTHGDAHVVVHKEILPPSLLSSRPTKYACNSGATTLSRCLQLRLSESSLILRSEIKLNPVISLNFSTARDREHSRDGDTGSNEGHGGRRENCLSLGNKRRSDFPREKKISLQNRCCSENMKDSIDARGVLCFARWSPSSHAIVRVNKKNYVATFKYNLLKFF